MNEYNPKIIDNVPTPEEKEKAERRYLSFLENSLEHFPISFKIGSVQYKGFSKDFTLIDSTTETLPCKTVSKNSLMHKDGLLFRVESTLYKDYAAYDWTVYVKNTSESNSRVISKLYAIDTVFEGNDPILYASYGDSKQYLPIVNNLEKNVKIAPEGGRGTQGSSSYFELQYGDEGVLYAIGWPGQWTSSLEKSKDGGSLRLTAGQENLNTYLEPGEEIRTPLIALVHYDTRDRERSINLWRRWMIDCNMHRVKSEDSDSSVLPAPGIYAATSIQWHEMTRATDENQKEAISYYLGNGIDLSYWWMDAGWYYKADNGKLTTLDDWGWFDTGTWIVDEERFPSKMNDISAYAAEKGIKTLLWFEPDRIANASALVTDLTTVHPSWVLSGYLLDLGNKEALDWTFERIRRVMHEGGISTYREDFNCDPLEAWLAADKAKSSSGKRLGITENHHITGHLELWDRILSEFPHAFIDSCASGGKRNDLETMRRAVPLHKTDFVYHDRAAQQAIATEMSRWIPYIGTKANGEVNADNLTTNANKYSLRTALVSGMVLGYDSAKDVPLDWDIVRGVTKEHSAISHLNYGDYYILEEWSRDESDFAAWEYVSREKDEGYVIAFRRATADAKRHYKLKGLSKAESYKIWFEDANSPMIKSGKELMEEGVCFALPCIESSDILHFALLEKAPENRILTPFITKTSVNGQHRGAIFTDGSAAYNRFDIRFNFAPRVTTLEKGEGKLEKDVTEDYAELIKIDGRTVRQMLKAEKRSVLISYDPINLILNINVKKALLSPKESHAVELSRLICDENSADSLCAYLFTYSPEDRAFTGEEIHTEPAIDELKISDEGNTYDCSHEKSEITEKVVSSADDELENELGLLLSEAEDEVDTDDTESLDNSKKKRRIKTVISGAAALAAVSTAAAIVLKNKKKKSKKK